MAKVIVDFTETRSYTGIVLDVPDGEMENIVANLYANLYDDIWPLLERQADSENLSLHDFLSRYLHAADNEIDCITDEQENFLD